MTKSIKKRNKARKKSPPTIPIPDEVYDLLEILESVPANAECWEEIEKKAWDAVPVPITTDGDSGIEKVVSEIIARREALRDELFAKAVSKLSPFGQAYVGPLTDLRSARDGYSLLLSIRETTYRMIESAVSGQPFFPYYDNDLSGDFGKGTLRINPKGRLEVIPDTKVLGWLIAHLKNVDVRLIKKCPICNKIFWAGRKDKRACSDKCSLVLRVQIKRGKWPEYVEAREKRQKERNAKMKEARLKQRKEK